MVLSASPPHVCVWFFFVCVCVRARCVVYGVCCVACVCVEMCVLNTPLGPAPHDLVSSCYTGLTGTWGPANWLCGRPGFSVPFGHWAKPVLGKVLNCPRGVQGLQFNVEVLYSDLGPIN